jgi:hypothetical protein
MCGPAAHSTPDPTHSHIPHPPSTWQVRRPARLRRGGAARLRARCDREQRYASRRYPRAAGGRRPPAAAVPHGRLGRVGLAPGPRAGSAAQPGPPPVARPRQPQEPAEAEGGARHVGLALLGSVPLLAGAPEPTGHAPADSTPATPRMCVHAHN